MRLHATLYYCKVYEPLQGSGHDMRKFEASTLGKVAIVVGTALIMYAVAGASVVTYPQYAAYYYSAGAGITTIITGLILAVQIEEPKQPGGKSC